jgi:HAD superfamily hydrolase (TIGR01450 family)
MGTNAFLIDLDGTIYLGDRLTPGAREFVNWLIDSGHRFRFLTNNSSNSAAFYVAKLRRLGIQCDDDSVFTSTKATIRYLRLRGIDTVFAMGTPPFVEELQHAGISLSDDANCVLLAFDKTLTYEKADRAFQLLQRGADFIATHPDVLCPTETGFSLDCGAMLAMFEKATQRTATIIGKPNPELVQLALSEIGAEPANAMVVGDRVYTDMRMGIEAGTKTALVLSGETKITSTLPLPIDFVLENVGQIPSLFIERSMTAVVLT